jgi:hypothetical protein
MTNASGTQNVNSPFFNLFLTSDSQGFAPQIEGIGMEIDSDDVS